MPAPSTYEVEILEPFEGKAAEGRRPLSPTQVIVALARPGPSGDRDRSTLLALLSEDERRRLARSHFERDRKLFLAAHALLRMTLSRFTNVEPGAWQFRTGSHGRPEIAEPRSRLRFSLSHTRGLAACAIMLDRDIGFDVEDASNGAPIDVVEHFFSPREVREVRSAPFEARAARFLEYWTLKEAYLKARGLGLSLPLDRFSLYKDAEDTWRIAFEPPLNDDPARWRFWSWRVSDDDQAALAICADRTDPLAPPRDPLI